MSTQSSTSPESVYIDDRDREELSDAQELFDEEEEEEEEEEEHTTAEESDESRTSCTSCSSRRCAEESESSESASSEGSACPEERTLQRLERLRDAVRQSESFDDEDLRQIERVVAAYGPKAARAREAREKQRRYADELRWMRQKLQERATVLDEAGIDFRAHEFAPLARFFMAKQKRLSACLEGVASQGS
tara:strand:- start:37 stop:609 length:573 start_codon:yes stop_codon:yes gene_type:complete